jgi:hypothetical protein
MERGEVLRDRTVGDDPHDELEATIVRWHRRDAVGAPPVTQAVDRALDPDEVPKGEREGAVVDDLEREAERSPSKSGGRHG